MFGSLAYDRVRFSTLWLILAIFLIGIGYLAILPPFEGIDEPAYYSSIEQVEQTGTFPALGQSYISRDVVDYRQHGPMSYNMLIFHEDSSERGSPITYARFSKSLELMADYVQRYRAFNPRPPYAIAADEPNWEAQHPPLYYLLMAPLMKITDFLPFVSQFFVLRLVSFAAAFVGILIALLATLKYAERDELRGRCLAAGFLLYPLIIPMFFVEFGRIGSDSLCLFFYGLVWYLMFAWLRNESDEAGALILGFCLGLGLLTKAFFLPIFAGVILFLFLQLWHDRKRKLLTPRRLGEFACIPSVAILIGGLWYFSRYVSTGSATGTLDAMTLLRQGGLIANLHELSLPNFMFNFAQTLVTWSWAGSWSGSRAMPFLQAPVLVFMAWIFIEYFSVARRRPLTSLAWWPFWSSIFFFAGLIWHILADIIGGNKNSTPGWYLSILAPAFSLAMAYGLQRIANDREKRFFLAGFLIYTVCFAAIVFWTQSAIYAGCAMKEGNGNYVYYYSGIPRCLGQLPDMATSLAVLGWPYGAAVAFCGGFLSLGFGVWFLLSGTGIVRGKQTDKHMEIAKN